MTLFSKKIAVVGGGFAGLCSISCLKEEGGFEPVCFEKTSNPGGTWFYREEAIVGVPSIMPTTIINHSKEMGALSDYPPPKEGCNFMRHNELYKYVIDYFKSKDVLKHVQCNMEVIKVRRAPDYEETGGWIVTVKNTVTGDETTDLYDGVFVCVGHMNRPQMPLYPGQELFKGKLLHTHSLRGVESFRDKNVVVVGMGCSALDAAVEISNVAKQVFISTRSGAHVSQRVGPHGYPLDWILCRRFLFALFNIIPVSILSWIVESLYIDPQFNKKLYNVKPNHHVFSKDPIINDHIASKLLSGLVKQRSDIERFTDDGVIFQGETEVTRAEAVIMGTGYTWKFPFLEDDVIVKEEGRINLYKCMFPIQLRHATLAIIGFVLPFGPGFPVGELQCRWATQVLADKCKLPSKEAMLKDVINRFDYNVKRYTPSEKMSVRVDFILYCDEIASQFGAKPNLFKMLFTDPTLFFKIVFGPSLSYQYRLQGPHSWTGAREAIMTCKDRILYPLTKRNAEDLYENKLVRIVKKIIRMLFFLIY